MTINNKFNLKDVVFLITDPHQEKRMVTGIKITPNGILYYLSLGSNESVHFECEMEYERNYANL